MGWHIGQRLHKFVHGFFRPSEAGEVRDAYNRTRRIADRSGMASDRGREDLVNEIAEDVITTLQIKDDQIGEVFHLVEALVEYEGFFMTPEVDLSEPRLTSEMWELKSQLKDHKRQLENLPKIKDAITMTVLSILSPIVHAIRELDFADWNERGLQFQTARIHHIPNLGECVEAMVYGCISEENETLNIFNRIRNRLEVNLVAASGGNPRDLESFRKPYKFPSKADYRRPEELIGTYLGGTPLAQLFDGSEVFKIPDRARFEHQHIVAGSGHGKTQTLQYLIANDLEAVANGERSVIVLDSQGDMIRNISKLQPFAPGGPLHDRIVIIDPTDIEWPVSLNLFDVGVDRLQHYPMLERERLTNSILELYDFVLGSLLSAEMTQKQGVIFRYVTRLMLHIPDATIHTLADLMAPGSEERYAEHIAKLEGTARRFFETEFVDKEFAGTRKQVLRRLWGVLENQTFERMFSHPRSKFNLYAEMNAGKVILINTAKDLLKEQGTEIFGRFFIALIAQAAQERAVISESDRLPVFVYIDEAADYFDRNIGIILSQARKYRVGMVLAHQYLGQLDAKLQDAFGANTAIKFAGGVSAKDARAMALMMQCEASLIEAQPKLSFAASVRGSTKSAVPITIEPGIMEHADRMTDAEYEILKDRMRERYAVHYTDLFTGSSASAGFGHSSESSDGQGPGRPNDHHPRRLPGKDNRSTDPDASW